MCTREQNTDFGHQVHSGCELLFVLVHPSCEPKEWRELCRHQTTGWSCFGEMCQGEPGRLFTANPMGIMQLDCHSNVFKLLQVIPTNHQAFGLAYLSRPRLIAFISGEGKGQIRAVSVDTSDTVWVSTACTCPASLAYLPGQGLLFVAEARGIVALNGSDGSSHELRPVQVMCGSCVSMATASLHNAALMTR